MNGSSPWPPGSPQTVKGVGIRQVCLASQASPAAAKWQEPQRSCSSAAGCGVKTQGGQAGRQVGWEL